MRIRILKIKAESEEYIQIGCHEMTDSVKEIVSFVKSRQGQILATAGGEQYNVLVSDIFYAEAVDNRCFLYCLDQVYETRDKLYMLEEKLGEKRFLRVSKSVLLNLMKIQSIKPALNGRFMAILSNGEEIIISRKYVPDLKKKLKGGEVS